MPHALTERLNSIERRHEHPNVRPSDAATLLILDRTAGAPVRVLMGKRHVRHSFYPGAYVFPGGRVDPADSRIRVAGDYHPDVLAKLMQDMKGPKTAARARAFGVAALRETQEEAGLFIGRSADPTSHQTGSAGTELAGFAEAHVMPDLAPFRFVARAITPPRRLRRFDTRFLACWATAIASRTADGLGPSGELDEVAWLTFEEARKTDLPTITLTILDEVAARLAVDPDLAPATEVPFYHWRGAGFVRAIL